MKIIYEKGDKVRSKETGEVKAVLEFLPDRGLIRVEGMTYRVDDVTPVLVDHSAKSVELAKLAELHGAKFAFDEYVQKEIESRLFSETRALKNRGMAAQIEFLLGAWGTHPERQEAALKSVVNIIADNSLKGMVECLACKGNAFKELCEKLMDGWRCQDCVKIDKRP